MITAVIGVKQSNKARRVGTTATVSRLLDLDADVLAGYAAEDPHGGWDHGQGTFPKGSVWRAEGQLLYALVRALRPRRVVDLGTHMGGSATHLAAALHANNRGRLVTIDRGFADIIVAVGEALLRQALIDSVVVRSRDRWLLRAAQLRGWRTQEVAARAAGARHFRGQLIGYRGAQRVCQLPGDVPLPFPGHLIPADLRSRCAVVIADAVQWLERSPGFDFVFEDLDHDRRETARIARLIKRKLHPGGVLVCHDALHPRYGAHVRRGLEDARVHPVGYVKIGSSDCGFAVWRKPR